MLMRDSNEKEKREQSDDNLPSPRSTSWSNNDRVVFIPSEDIRVIERVLDEWDTVKQQWNTMRCQGAH